MACRRACVWNSVIPADDSVSPADRCKAADRSSPLAQNGGRLWAPGLRAAEPSSWGMTRREGALGNVGSVRTVVLQQAWRGRLVPAAIRERRWPAVAVFA